MLSADVAALAQTIGAIVLDGLREDLPGLLGREAAPAIPSPPSLQVEWLTAEQAAEYLGMKVKALYSAVARRRVPASRLGSRLRFNRVGLDRLLHQAQTRAVKHSLRVPSPGKESERW
jgi:excisionase family DNA binding protein